MGLPARAVKPCASNQPRSSSLRAGWCYAQAHLLTSRLHVYVRACHTAIGHQRRTSRLHQPLSCRAHARRSLQLHGLMVEYVRLRAIVVHVSNTFALTWHDHIPLYGQGRFWLFRGSMRNPIWMHTNIYNYTYIIKYLIYKNYYALLLSL
jgi:hypothetical protein